MSDDANIIHHAGLISHSLEATVAQYERLGFAFAPLSEPRIILHAGGEPETIGVGNRHAIFRDNYLEVLGTTNPERWATITTDQRGSYDIDRPLARYEGLHVMHFGTDDIQALYDRLSMEGIACSDIHPFQRNVDTPDGPHLMRALAIGFPPPANPEGLIQIAQHLTPDLVLQPRYQNHPNGATHLAETTVCAEDPEQYASKYAQYANHSTHTVGEVFVVDLGRSRIRITSPETLPSVLPGATPPAVPALVGFTVTVTDLERTRTHLDGNDIPHELLGSAITVPAHAGSGSAVTFEQA